MEEICVGKKNISKVKKYLLEKGFKSGQAVLKEDRTSYFDRNGKHISSMIDGSEYAKKYEDMMAFAMVGDHEQVTFFLYEDKDESKFTHDYQIVKVDNCNELDKIISRIKRISDEKQIKLSEVE